MQKVDDGYSRITYLKYKLYICVYRFLNLKYQYRYQYQRIAVNIYNNMPSEIIYIKHFIGMHHFKNVLQTYKLKLYMILTHL